METIAVAAIVLVVLIIAIIVFRGGINKILPSVYKVNECASKKGTCFNPNDPTDIKCDAGTQIWGLGCEKDPKKVYCCVPPLNV